MTSADFAAAQQRVAARRQKREAAAQDRIAERQRAQTAGYLSRLPQPARSLWTSLGSQWDTIRGREGTRPAFRVGQVDAELLDEELLELLKGQVGEALKYYGTHLRDDYGAEILLSLRAILFKLTIWDHDASYGASLQNLKYTDARGKGSAPLPAKRWQKALYGLVSVGGRYAWTKWEDFLLDAEAGYDEPTPRMRILSRFSSLLSTTHAVAAFASFLFFLVNGKYRTILDRVLRLRLTPITSQVSREVSFEYLNRQLVWHAFTEFLLFLLPLVGISRWRRWLARAWRKTAAMFRRSESGEDEDLKSGGEFGFLPERTCAICYQDQNPTNTAESEMAAISGASSGIVGSSQTDITNPYETISCGCVYCFVCLAQRLESEDGEGWTCLRCGELVRECRPWDGDVLEEPRSRSSSGKSVSFAAEEKRDKAAFTTLEPIPLEDELSAEVEAEIEEAVEQPVTRSLVESGEWSNIDSSAGIAEDEEEHQAGHAEGETDREEDAEDEGAIEEESEYELSEPSSEDAYRNSMPSDDEQADNEVETM